MTTHATTQWCRVTKANPCPVCSRPDWCGISSDGAVAICMRVESRCPSRNGGWIHHVGERSPGPIRFAIRALTPRAGLRERLHDLRCAATPMRLEAYAARLGVQVGGLVALQAGYCEQRRCWAFPMFDAERRLVGIRYRAANGRKWSERGGAEGLFVPALQRQDGPLLLPEGATDSVALIGLGFAVVGRPSCTGGVQHCIAFARGRDVVVVADADEPGRHGAGTLAHALLPYATTVRVVVPPAKDMRQWVLAGAGRADVLDLVGNSEVQRMRLREIAR